MMADAEIRRVVMEAVSRYPKSLRLMLLGTAEASQHRDEAGALGLDLYFEAFADRCYDDDGRLLSRRKPGAVHTRERMLEQVRQLCDEGTVTTVSGKRLTLPADTLCVHGDNAEGIAAIRDIRSIVGNG